MTQCSVLAQVQEEARHANASMLERATMSDRIKSVMGLIRRYESLFQLPTRIVQETERGEFETVSTCCHDSCMQLVHPAFFLALCGLLIACRLAQCTSLEIMALLHVLHAVPRNVSVCKQFLVNVGKGFSACCIAHQAVPAIAILLLSDQCLP